MAKKTLATSLVQNVGFIGAQGRERGQEELLPGVRPGWLCTWALGMQKESGGFQKNFGC